MSYISELYRYNGFNLVDITSEELSTEERADWFEATYKLYNQMFPAHEKISKESLKNIVFYPDNHDDYKMLIIGKQNEDIKTV